MDYTSTRKVSFILLLHRNMHVQEIKKIYDIASGCTQPILVTLDDRSDAVLKYPNNPQGMMVLFNEYFSYMLAKELSLTIPEFGIAVIDAQTNIEKLPGNYHLSTFEGVCFFTTYLPDTVPLSCRIASHISNLDETSKMLLLDEIVRNGDRSNSNVLVGFRTNQAQMYAIDYSHAFGDPEWSSDTLQIGDYDSPYVWQEKCFLYDMLIKANADVSPARLESEASLICERINQDFVHRIIESVPSKWVESIGKSNILHAGEYVLSRVNSIGKICTMINRERGL